MLKCREKAQERKLEVKQKGMKSFLEMCRLPDYELVFQSKVVERAICSSCWIRV